MAVDGCFVFSKAPWNGGCVLSVEVTALGLPLDQKKLDLGHAEKRRETNIKKDCLSSFGHIFLTTSESVKYE